MFHLPIEFHGCRSVDLRRVGRLTFRMVSRGLYCLCCIVYWGSVVMADEPAAGVSDAVLQAFEQAALTQAGDPQAGEKLFNDSLRTKCSVCHRVGKLGGTVGPALTQIGGKFDRPHLIESVLEPSRQIVEGYRTTSFLLNSGEIIQGIVKERSDHQIRGLDVNNQVFQIDTSKIQEVQLADISLMPAGLAASITPTEFSDLIAYLESLRDGQQKMGAAVSGPIIRLSA